MCGRFTLTVSDRSLSAAFGQADWPPERLPRWNIAPTQEVLCLRWENSAVRPFWLRWGLVPHWAVDAAGASRLINARGETLLEKSSFKNLVPSVSHRCLMLADGFYEWHDTGSGKVPQYFSLPGGQPFAFAGLCDRWSNPATGQMLETVTLVNHAAPPWMAWCHHRAPVVLDAPKRLRWLDPTEKAAENLADFLAPWPPAGSGGFQATAVAKTVNSVRNDGPDCLLPTGTLLQGPAGPRQGLLFD